MRRQGSSGHLHISAGASISAPALGPGRRPEPRRGGGEGRPAPLPREVREDGTPPTEQPRTSSTAEQSAVIGLPPTDGSGRGGRAARSGNRRQRVGLRPYPVASRY